MPLAGIALPLTGRLHGGIKPDGERAPVRFELTGGPGQVDLPDLLMAPLPIEAVRAEGELASDLEHLTVQRFEAERAGGEPRRHRRAVLAGSHIRRERRGRGAQRRRPRSRPVLAARGRRRRRAPGCSSTSPTASCRRRRPRSASSRAIWPCGLCPRASSRAVSRIDDLTVGYYEELPPLTGVDGSATFTARRMDFTIDAGRIGDIAVEGGSVVITGMGIPGRETTQLEVRTKAAGPVRDILALIDHPPLRLAGKAGVSPADAAGMARRRPCDRAAAAPRCQRRGGAGRSQRDADRCGDSHALLRPAGRPADPHGRQCGLRSRGRCGGRRHPAADRGAREFRRRRALRAALPGAAAWSMPRRSRSSWATLPLELAGAVGLDATIVESGRRARGRGRPRPHAARDREPLARLAQGRRRARQPERVAGPGRGRADRDPGSGAVRAGARGDRAACSCSAEPLALETLELERVRFGADRGRPHRAPRQRSGLRGQRGRQHPRSGPVAGCRRAGAGRRPARAAPARAARRARAAGRPGAARGQRRSGARPAGLAFGLDPRVAAEAAASCR